MLEHLSQEVVLCDSHFKTNHLASRFRIDFEDRAEAAKHIGKSLPQTRRGDGGWAKGSRKQMDSNYLCSLVSPHLTFRNYYV